MALGCYLSKQVFIIYFFYLFVFINCVCRTTRSFRLPNNVVECKFSLSLSLFVLTTICIVVERLGLVGYRDVDSRFIRPASLPSNEFALPPIQIRGNA